MLKLTEEQTENLIITDPFDFRNPNFGEGYFTQNLLFPKEAIYNQYQNTSTKNKRTPKEYKKIIKKFKGNITLPHPNIISDMIEYKNKKTSSTSPANKKSYLKISKATNAVISISNFLSMSFSTHEKTGDLAISSKYMTKSLSSFRSYFDFYSMYLERTHQGNNLDEYGCSSYLFTNNPYKDETKVYSHENKVKEVVTKVLKGSMSLAKYKDFYSKKKISNTYTKKELTIKALIDETNVYNNPNKVKEIFEEDINTDGKYSSVIKIRLLESKESIEKRIAKYYQSLPEKASGYKRRIQRDFKKLMSYIHDEHIYIKRTFTTIGREYDFLNQMPKGLRNVLFENYIEMDLKNAAYNLVINKLEKEGFDVETNESQFKSILYYAKNRDKVIGTIVDIYSKKYNVKSVTQLSEIRGILKTKFLSFMFGSKNSLYKAYTKREQNIYNSIKELQFYSKLQREIKTLNSVIEDMGFNQISDMFMEEETKIMTSLKAYLSNKGVKLNKIISIHDGILIHKDEVTKLTIEDTYELNELLKENHQFIDFKDTRKYIRNNDFYNEASKYTAMTKEDFKERLPIENETNKVVIGTLKFLKDMYFNSNDLEENTYFKIRVKEEPKEIKKISERCQIIYNKYYNRVQSYKVIESFISEDIISRDKPQIILLQ